MLAQTDILIVGGGVVGGSIAFHLAAAGAEVTVVDRDFPARGTSGATVAMVWVHGKTPNYYGAFSSLSAELYRDLHKRLGMDVEYRRTGGITTIFNAKEMAEAKQLVAHQREVGLELHMLSREEALKLEPKLSPAIIGAVMCRDDGDVNPMRLAYAYMKAAVPLGAEYNCYTEVQSMEREGSGFLVRTSRGIIRCRRLVLAGGAWTPEFTRMLGFEIPVRPVRGHVLVTEPLDRIYRFTVRGVRQTANGECLIGTTHEEVGYNLGNDPARILEIAPNGPRHLPWLANVNIVRCYTGVRPWPKDGLPVLGTIPGQPGVYVAATHSGVTLSPLLGLLTSELVLDREPSVDVSPYAVTRFN